MSGSDGLKARKSAGTSGGQNLDKNYSLNLDRASNNSSKKRMHATTPSKGAKVRNEQKKKSSFRCTPVKILLCFLCGWITLGSLGVLLYAKQHTSEVQNIIRKNFPGYHFSFRNEPLRNQLIDAKRLLRLEREKRRALFKNAKKLISAEQAKVLQLKGQLKSAGVRPSGGSGSLNGDSNGGYAGKDELFMEKQIKQFYQSGKQQGGNKIDDIIDMALEGQMDEVLYRLHNSMLNNDLSFFLFGPSLQRFLGGQLAIESGFSGSASKYVRSLHIGVWFHHTSASDDDMVSKLKLVFGNMQYTMPSSSVVIPPGMPGDLIFVPESSRGNSMVPVYVSPFYRGQTFVWHGGRRGPKISYENFLTTSTEASLLEDDAEQTTLFIPTNPDNIFKEQRGESLAFGGHNQRILSSTMAAPANLLVSCLDTASFDDYSIYADENDEEEEWSKMNAGQPPKNVHSANKAVAKNERGSQHVANKNNVLAEGNGHEVKESKDVTEVVDGNKFVFHTVSSKDTIKSIIHRYHISEADFRTWNELTGDLHVGEEYIVQLSIKNKQKNTLATSKSGSRTRRRRLLRSDQDLMKIVRRFGKANIPTRQKIWHNEVLSLSENDQTRILSLLESLSNDNGKKQKKAQKKKDSSKANTLRSAVKRSKKGKLKGTNKITDKSMSSHKTSTTGDSPENGEKSKAIPQKHPKKKSANRGEQANEGQKHTDSHARQTYKQKQNEPKKESGGEVENRKKTKSNMSGQKQSATHETSEKESSKKYSSQKPAQKGNYVLKKNSAAQSASEKDDHDSKKASVNDTPQISSHKYSDSNLKETQNKPSPSQVSSKNTEEKMPEAPKEAIGSGGDLQKGKDESKQNNFDQKASQNGKKDTDADISKSKSSSSNSQSTSTKGVYVAKEGDDIYSVAQKFGISPETLRALNGLDPENSEDEIEAGEEYIIRVPGMKPIQTSSASKRKHTKSNVDGQRTQTKNIVAKRPEKCENSCPYANDGSCDDGGEGAEYSSCELGTDCSDCGPRPEKGGTSPIGIKSHEQKKSSREMDKGTTRTTEVKADDMPTTDDSALGQHELKAPKQDPFVDTGKQGLFPETWEDDANGFDYIKSTDTDEDLIDKYCNNNCQYASDGICDDGGSGSKSQVCKFGSDCADCGNRGQNKGGKGASKEVDTKVAEAKKQKSYYPISTTKKMDNGDISEVFLDNAFIYHTCKASDTIESLSNLYRVSTKMIQHWNNIRKASDIVPGTEYLVWRGEPSDKLMASRTESKAGGTTAKGDNDKDSKTGSPIAPAVKKKLFVGGRFYVDMEELRKGAIAPISQSILPVGEKVFVRSGSSVYTNFWFRAHIVSATVQKRANGEESMVYTVEPVNVNDPNTKIHIGEKIGRENIVLDQQATSSELMNEIHRARERDSRHGRIIIFGRISGIIGGWESQLIEATADGKFVAETMSQKGLKRNALNPQFFRIFDKQDTSGNQQGVAHHIRMASAQTLYLAEHVLRTNKIIFWLSGSALASWKQLCTIIPNSVNVLGNHDINIGVHLFDWEKSVKKDLQRYGFELVATNGKEIAKETEDASDFEGLQYIFSRPVYCSHKHAASIVSAKPSSLAMCNAPGMKKYNNVHHVRLVIDVYHTRHNFNKEIELYSGVFDKEGVLTGLSKKQLFELKWAEFHGRRLRIPV